MFLLSDAQVADEQFLVLVNDFLASGTALVLCFLLSPSPVEFCSWQHLEFWNRQRGNDEMSWKLHGLSSRVKAVPRPPWGGTLHQLGHFLSFPHVSYLFFHMSWDSAHSC